MDESIHLWYLTGRRTLTEWHGSNRTRIGDHTGGILLLLLLVHYNNNVHDSLSARGAFSLLLRVLEILMTHWSKPELEHTVNVIQWGRCNFIGIWTLNNPGDVPQNYYIHYKAEKCHLMIQYARTCIVFDIMYTSLQNCYDVIQAPPKDVQFIIVHQRTVLYNISHSCANNITNTQGKQWTRNRDNQSVQQILGSDTTPDCNHSLQTEPSWWKWVRNRRSVFSWTLDLCLLNVRRQHPGARGREREREKEALRNEECDTDTGKFLCPQPRGGSGLRFPGRDASVCTDSLH